MADELKKEAFDLKISHNVFFAGVRSDVSKIVNAFDVFVLTSLYEGLGISAVEAQANGLPCILSDAIPKEADLTNVTFISVNQKPQMWAEAIVKHTRARDLTQNGKVKEKGYDILNEAKKLELFYKDLVC